MSISKNILKSAFRDLSKKLGATEDFIIDIHKEENSWSFTSKLAQLIEGVFTKILVQKLKEPEIYSTKNNLPHATRINLPHDFKIINKEKNYFF